MRERKVHGSHYYWISEGVASASDADTAVRRKKINTPKGGEGKEKEGKKQFSRLFNWNNKRKKKKKVLKHTHTHVGLCLEPRSHFR